MANLQEIAENIRKRDLVEALKLCDEYENEKNKYLIYNFKGVIYLLKNDLDIAETKFLEAEKINNKFIDPIKNLYLIYLKKKSFKNLLIYAKKLFAIDNLNSDYAYKLAYAYELNYQQGNAIRQYILCIELNGENKKQSLNNIGCIYIKRNKPKIALDYFLKSIEFGEDKIIVNNTLNSYIMLRDLEKCSLYMSKAEEFDKNFIDFQYNKARYLILKNEITEAIEILNKNKDKPKFLTTLLILYFNLGENDQGNKLFSEIKNEAKKNPEFYNYYALKLLEKGDFEEGWKYYEHRNSKQVDFFKDDIEWTGEKIDKKHIVVFNEQAFGDCIQFSKYIIPLTKIANNVTFVVKDSVKNLFKKEIKNLSIETIENCKNKKFDFKIALGSLIKFFYKHRFKENENLISTNVQNDNKWNDNVSNDKLNVGIVWSGSYNGANEPYRSVPLKSLKKLFSLDVNFYSLQNEIWDRDLEFLKSLNLIDCSKYKLDEIASLIKNLDLVITSDTSLLHLSASLNKETWGMLSLHPDWRWGEFYKTSPYPSLKIFKQTKFCDWTNVENEITIELKKKIDIFNSSKK